MTRLDADNYLKLNGFQIIRIEGVIYAAVINENGNENGFEIEILVDYSKFEDDDLRNYRNGIEVTLLRLKDLENRINDQNSIRLKKSKSELTKCLEKIHDFNFYKDFNENLIKIQKNNLDRTSFEIKQEINYSYRFLSTLLNDRQLELKNNIRNNINKKIEEIEGKLDIKKASTKIVIENMDYEVDYLNEVSSLKRGNPIKNSNRTEHGTLGGVLKLKEKDDYFLISNWHVLMGYTGEIGNKININTEIPFAELFWARHDSEFDVAIARVTKPNLITESTCNKCNHSISMIPTEAKIGTNVSICGYKSKSEVFTKIRSTNTYIKLKNGRLFKNQILTEKSISIKGDSGAIVVNDNNEAVGLVFAGDQKYFTIANPISKLLKNLINFTIINNEYIDDFEPFQFEKFIN